MSSVSVDKFQRRHLGSSTEEVAQMLQTIGVESINELIKKTVPGDIRLEKPLTLSSPLSEQEFLSRLSEIASENKVFKSYIGMGYYNTYTPNVILRNILENPGWYTAYTPYQAEIAQGRLEMLLNYQTMVTELTGMDLANASLLDEGTAAAEAMTLMYAVKDKSKSEAHKVFVSKNLHPQTIDVLAGRAEPIGIELVIDDENKFDFNEQFFAAFVAYPATSGAVKDYSSFVEKAHNHQILVTFVADLLSLTLLKSPGEMGADVVVGSAQRFGVPMGYGGPHAGFFATKDAFKRNIPGRIIGVSIDAQGNKAYRMALQTREQHIRREKATSNICTAQVLLSVMAAAYAIYHGPEGLKKIATNVNSLTTFLAQKLQSLGFELENKSWFDTLSVKVNSADKLLALALEKEINFRKLNDKTIGISLDETTSKEDVFEILSVFAALNAQKLNKEEFLAEKHIGLIPSELKRSSTYMLQSVFSMYHTEHEMLRYLKKLENKDLSMVHSMISLGSCTMKLNATTEMIPVTWPKFGALHPFVPQDQAKGYQIIIEELSAWLAKITGFEAVSLQPNSGAQGEYAGLMAIRAYHKDKGQGHRNIALIPSSAHGTNPASAVMAGMKVVVTKCDENGNIDLEDLTKQAIAHKDNLSCLMITYPSTHGVFEEHIKEVIKTIHDFGGLVYMDGANMNAQVGLTSPGTIGADVCHLNLHKTFCIPHGGGGPGMGPIGVAKHLVPYLPGHAVVTTGGEKAINAISAAPYGSASILLISYAYISMMGGEGLTEATKYAILNANYIKSKLEKHYPVLYTGTHGYCAHEMILDCRGFKHSLGIEVEDIAKRLMDYGYHAPTVSFPVAGTLMIEPTESESKAELDKFCDAMISIRNEIAEIEAGTFDKTNNVLKNAPHTALVITADEWSKPYSRQKAAYPLEWIKEAKFWPSVGRIDNAYGDRNLVCTCEPVEAYS
ncbi:MAG: aminomethyl-transferring glycine dehydrogenase [Cytophagales bacterium]